jgi:hypothetical protein
LSNRQIAELEKIIEAFTRLRNRHGVSAFKHLGFGSTDKQIQTGNYLGIGFGKLGELNSKNQLHGKGIDIFLGRITFARYENGKHAEGNYVWFDMDGYIEVGRIYFKDGKRKRAGT